MSAAATPAPATAVPQPVRPPAERDRTALLEAAPELTAESAAVLEHSAWGASHEVLARTSLLEASRGFAHLAPEDLRALGIVFERAYGGLGPAERAQLEAYLEGLRNGRVPDAAVERAARQTFNRAIGSLTPGDRDTLRALYARAIGKGLEAAQRASLAPLPAAGALPQPASPPVVTPVGGVQLPDGATETRSATPEPVDSDALARERAAPYRQAIRAAEERVKQAEEGLKWAEEHWHFVNSHTNHSAPLDEARYKLENARKSHAAAKDSLDAAEARARQAGIPPGWLR